MIRNLVIVDYTKQRRRRLPSIRQRQREDEVERVAKWPDIVYWRAFNKLANKKSKWLLVANIPVLTKSEANTAGHEKWKATAARARAQKYVVQQVWPREATVPAAPLRVTFVRVAPRGLDAGNLSTSFKYVQDAVAVELGLFKLNRNGKAIPLDGPKDGTTWDYRQERGDKYGVRVEVETCR